MAFMSRSGTLCSLQYKHILKQLPRFSQQQIHYSILIDKPIQVFLCLHPKNMLQFQYRFQHNSNGNLFN